MNILLHIYNYVVFLFLLFVFPFYWFFQRFYYNNKIVVSQRLGLYPYSIFKKNINYPVVWIHASSIGEIKIAYRIINILRSKFKNISLLLSTITVSGNEYAKKMIGTKATIIFAPLDLSFCIQLALLKIRPKILVYIETEIWLNWINKAHSLGIATIFLNGKISKKSFYKYKKITPILKFILGKVDIFSMVSQSDRSRIIKIGASADRVFVNGNAKFDLIESEYSHDIFEKMHKLYGLFDDPPVFVAGSVRASEELYIINAYILIKQKYNDVVLIIAPRHMNRVPKIEKLAKNKGLKTMRRSSISNNFSSKKDYIIILDTIGELTASYSVATVVFCGASLVKLGGQNILEAAAWAKPVIHGPFMDDFKEASDLLQKHGASIIIKSGDKLAEAVISLLDNLDHAKHIGDLARKIVLSSNGTTNKHTNIVGKFIEKFIQDI